MYGNSVRGVECMVVCWVCCGLLCYANHLSSPASGYSQPWWVARVVECGNPGGDRGSSAGGDTGTQGGWQGDTGRSISGHNHHHQVWDTSKCGTLTLERGRISCQGGIWRSKAKAQLFATFWQENILKLLVALYSRGWLIFWTADFTSSREEVQRVCILFTSIVSWSLKGKLGDFFLFVQSFYWPKKQ